MRLHSWQIERFRNLAVNEPKLAMLLRAASTADQGEERFCAMDAFNGRGGEPGLKHRVARLVGSMAGIPEHGRGGPYDVLGVIKASLKTIDQDIEKPLPPELTTQEAYDLVYNVVLRSLPPCRRCEHDEAWQANCEGYDQEDDQDLYE